MATTIVVGFSTGESRDTFFWFYGTEVTILREKKNEPQGDGSPHVIVEMEVGRDFDLNRLYPDGTLLSGSFEEQ